jgi:hypothetical protein
VESHPKLGKTKQTRSPKTFHGLRQLHLQSRGPHHPRGREESRHPERGGPQRGWGGRGGWRGEGLQIFREELVSACRGEGQRGKNEREGEKDDP